MDMMQLVKLWEVEDGLIVGNDDGQIMIVSKQSCDDYPAHDLWAIEVTYPTTNRVLFISPEDATEQTTDINSYLVNDRWWVRAAYASAIKTWFKKGEPKPNESPERAFIEGR